MTRIRLQPADSRQVFGDHADGLGQRGGLDTAVGNIGLWTSNIEVGHANTGYWIAPQARRRGYLTAALRTLTSWALAIPEVERLELYVEPWNEASWRAAETAGYQREGLLRAWQRIGDTRKDMYMYGILRPR